VLAALALVLAGVGPGCGGHRHGPARDDDPRRLYVEVAADRRALRDGAHAGLAKVAFAVPTRHNGDVELQVEVSRIETTSNATRCSVKILVLRLPQHDLLGIADGSARAQGTDGRARDDCLAGVTTSLVRGKVRALLRRRLDAKR
jgi:hypothetical protein